MAAITATGQDQEPEQKKTRGGTFQLSEIAEVRMRGGDIPAPGSKEEELIQSAWNAYRYIRAQAQRAGQEAIRFGRDGWEVSLEMPEVFHAVWPAGQSPLPIAGEDHDEGRRTLTLWLCTQQNLAMVSRGNPDLNARRGGTVPARPSRWWVASEFAGVPEGMRLPETVSGMTGEVVQAMQDIQSEPASRDGSDWWCPFDNQCELGVAVTERELISHFRRRHGGSMQGFLFESFMDDARALRGTEPAQPEPEPEYLPQPPARRVRSTSIASDMPPVIHPPAVAGSIGVQARVFAGEVAQLEQENESLRSRIRDLEEELSKARKEQRVTVDLTAENADSLARRIAALVKSENELS